MKMTSLSSEQSSPGKMVWIALKRLDKNDEGVVALREVSIPPADATTVIQIITNAFELNSTNVVLKIRNPRGYLIPINSSIPANSKHLPHVLEVTKIFQHVRPKPRSVPITMINATLKTRLQTIERRIDRLDDLLPEIKLRHIEKITQETDCLNQTIQFLHKRMQVADSHSWKGTLTRSPLW